MTELHQILTLAQMALATAVGYTCFCRLVMMDHGTVTSILLSFWAKGTAALLLAGAPLLPVFAPAECPWPPGTTPLWCFVIYLMTSLAVQVATAVHWRGGVPLDFLKDMQ